MSNVARFLSLLIANGQDATYHREQGGTDCPCLIDGFPDMEWHEDNPGAPMHNEQGKIGATITEVGVKGFIQPVQSSRATRLQTEYLDQMFGDIQTDDHIGIMPLMWSGVALDFREWSQAGEDFLLFDGRRFIVVNSNKMPDPSGGDFHHWEVAMRLIKIGRPG